MKFSVITLFPELITPYRESGLLGRGVREGLVQLECIQLRDFAVNTQGQVDDTPYGGGSGMLLRPDAARDAIASAKQALPNAAVVMFSPSGKRFNQVTAKRLLKDHQEFILLCNRYEGADQRIADSMIDYEISMGDFVCQGGELPALTFIETLSRLEPGVLGNPESASDESFESGLLEHPQYTKPADFEGQTVPEILLSGDHQKIADWRKDQAWRKTVERRPDLAFQKGVTAENVSIALIHHPVLNKGGEVITSSITNIDVHDIARSSQTFGLKNFFVVHPGKTLRRLVAKICEHWEVGYGASYNPNRKDALSLVQVLPNLEDVILSLEEKSGKRPLVITTSAKKHPENSSFEEARQEILLTDREVLILLGTGWGLVDEVHEAADIKLEPVEGWTDYNHLSVRGAAAIILDRLFGKH